MDTASFNLILINLLVGIFKGNKMYVDVCVQLHDEYYGIHGIEYNFKVGNTDVVPEILLTSIMNDSSIMMESTNHGSMNSKKERQIREYLGVTSHDLVSSAAVPRNASRNISLWLIIRPNALDSFKAAHDFSGQPSLKISSFEDTGDGYRLSSCSGFLAGSKINAVFDNDLFFARIYRGYIKISVDDMNAKLIGPSIMQVLVKFYLDRNYRFQVGDIAKRLIHVWDDFGAEKKVGVITGIHKVLKEYANHSMDKRMIYRVDNDRYGWEIRLNNELTESQNRETFLKSTSKFNKHLTEGTLTMDFTED